MARLRSVACLAAAATLAGAMVSPAAGSQRCRNAAQQVETLHIEAVWDKRTYARRSTATATVTVSRPADRDPIGQGIPLDPPTRMGAADVNIAVTVMAGFPYPFRIETTDQDGIATAAIALPKDARGPIDANVFAWTTHNPNGPACTEITEAANLRMQPAFRVR